MNTKLRLCSVLIYVHTLQKGGRIITAEIELLLSSFCELFLHTANRIKKQFSLFVHVNSFWPLLSFVCHLYFCRISIAKESSAWVSIFKFIAMIGNTLALFENLANKRRNGRNFKICKTNKASVWFSGRR